MAARLPQAPPYAPVLPSVTPEEMDFLVARTGMSLNAGQVADLVLAWRQVSAIAATIPRREVMADDFAFAFRLPPPGIRSAGKARVKAAPKAALAKPGRSKR